MSFNSKQGIGANSEVDVALLAACQDDAASTVVVDSSSNGDDGTLTNSGNTSAQSTTGPTSYLPKSLTIDDGDNDGYILFGTNPLNTIESSDEFVIEYWINFTTLSTGIRVNLTDGTSGSDLLRIRIEGATKVFNFRLDDGTTILDATGTTALATGTDYNVRFVYDGSKAELFLDGVSECSLTGTALNFTDLGDLIVGNKTTLGLPVEGSMSGLFISSSSADASDLDDGPELNYASGASIDKDGNYNVGTWAVPSPYSGSNGTPVYSVIAVESDGTSIDTATASSGTLDLSSLGSGETAYLMVRATNDGGFDVGDFATRTSSYGSAADGYFEISSVTAPGTPMYYYQQIQAVCS